MGRVLYSVFAFKGNSVKKLISSTMLALACVAGSAQAAWDAKFVAEPNGVSYFADYYLAEGNWRTVKQLHSLDQPDVNGFLYVEHVAEYDCQKRVYAVVQSRGFRTWDDVGQNLKLTTVAWHPVVQDNTQQQALDRMCSVRKMADAKSYIQGEK